MPSDSPHEIDELVKRHMSALRVFVRVRMGKELRAREESCDIVQSVAREVLQNGERFQFGGDQGFREWMFTTAHRKILNRLEHWRADKRSPRREADDQIPEELQSLGITPSQHASVREELRAIEAAFDTLTEEQREIVTMSRFLGMTHAAIAYRLGKTDVAVRKVLSRGLARLATALSQRDGELGS
ncbi:MAG: sigma-70 family RNA polymerase sigma factor [Planctomycetes bacterium]|jgi:RNA polymerase sigma factor (sigma-70 family)|nr:sigma-70 family RNA polymerase sigma factor [Planctomycetota bacterium]